MRRGEGLVERDQRRIAVHQDQIVVALDQIQHLGDALGLRRLDQDVADGTYDGRPPRRGKRRVEHRQKLESELTSSEREQLGHDDVRLDVGEQAQQPSAARGAERVVDLAPVGIDQNLEVFVGRPHRCELD